MSEQLPLPLPKRFPTINGDQFHETAELLRAEIGKLSRQAAILEQLAIEAWARAEPQRSITTVRDPYLQTR